MASEQPEPDELCGDSVNVLAAACLSASGSDYHDRHDAPFHAIDNPVALSHCADAAITREIVVKGFSTQLRV